jgi:predicted ATP-dependent serine protease
MTKIKDNLIKQFGSVAYNANRLKENSPQIISISPKINTILSGGIPEGSFVVLTGGPGVGKSSLALQIGANGQKQSSDWGQRTVYYFDIEARLKERDVFGNRALNTSENRFEIYGSQIGNIVTGDEFLDM